MYQYNDPKKFENVLMTKSAYNKVEDKRYLNKEEAESKIYLNTEKSDSKIISKIETGSNIPVQNNVMSNDTKKLIKFGAKAVGIGIVAAILYSPGLIALSIFDASILKATLAIVLGLALGSGLLYSTYQFFRPDKKQIKTINSSIDVTELSNKLKAYTSDRYMGQLASQALSQIDRINRSIKRVEFEIANKFESSSMTYRNYYGAIENAGNCAFKNLASFVNRIQLYTEEDFASLKNYKDDDIPDEIQEKQIDLMNKNKDLAKDALTANENLILGLESLAIEIADANFTADSQMSRDMLEEIDKLTNTIKYYI